MTGIRASMWTTSRLILGTDTAVIIRATKVFTQQSNSADCNLGTNKRSSFQNHIR